MQRWLAIGLLCSAGCAIALPIAETAQPAKGPPTQQQPMGITLPPSVLSTQPLESVAESESGEPRSQIEESQRKLATALGVDDVSLATATRETDDWVLWIGFLVAILVALQLAFDSLDFSFFGIDSRARQRRLAQESEQD